MIARNPPSPSKNQPIGLRARRTTSAPRPAYTVAAGPGGGPVVPAGGSGHPGGPAITASAMGPPG